MRDVMPTWSAGGLHARSQRFASTVPRALLAFSLVAGIVVPLVSVGPSIELMANVAPAAGPAPGPGGGGGSQACVEFDKLMEEKPQRIEALRKLLSENGIELRSSDEGLQELNDWFRREVEPNPDQLGRLMSIWYAVVNDIALFVGDTMIERCPNLNWVMFDKGKKDISYQRHVIVGFTKVPNPNFNVDVDVDLIIAMYGHRIIGGKDVDADRFVGMVRESENDA